MALNEPQQIQKLCTESQHILVVFTATGGLDALVSALALKLWLEKNNKFVDVVTDIVTASKQLHWLPGARDIKPKLTGLQKLIIKVDVKHAPLQTLSYDVKGEQLSIYLTPAQGTLSKNDLRTAQSSFKYDLILTLKTPDLPALGEMYHNNQDLFYRVPIINLDCEAHNERFGQVNVVETTATSVSEVVLELLKKIAEPEITPAMAECLLTGLVHTTKSFTTATVTPHTLKLAGELINRGADREKIIQALYRTRTVPTLKLWGQALSNLRSLPEFGLVWTALTRDDFIRSGTEPHHLSDVVDELISSSPEAKIILLLHEALDTLDCIYGIITANNHYHAQKLILPHASTGDKKRATFMVAGKNLKEAEDEIVKLVTEATSRN